MGSEPAGEPLERVSRRPSFLDRWSPGTTKRSRGRRRGALWGKGIAQGWERARVNGPPDGSSPPLPLDPAGRSLCSCDACRVARDVIGSASSRSRGQTGPSFTLALDTGRYTRWPCFRSITSDKVSASGRLDPRAPRARSLLRDAGRSERQLRASDAPTGYPPAGANLCCSCAIAR
jgi:hypothetical protein